eukprot:gene5582-7707_t
MARVDKEPCPFRIVEDAGGAFIFGLVGGTIWHFCGGLRNAPANHGWSNAVSRTHARTPMLGGSFAAWGAIFSCFDCTFTYIRRKEDPWNAILSGAATGGILAARAGLKAAGKNALMGGVLLAGIEGFNILLLRVIMPMMEKNNEQLGIQIDKLLPPIDPNRQRLPANRSSSSSSSKAPFWAPEPKFNPSIMSSGENKDNTPKWDTPGFIPVSNGDQSESENKVKPFWKFW